MGKLDKTIRNVFLISMIVFFLIGGLIGSSFFLFGSFGEIQLKILLTTLTLFIFSLLGLASSRTLKREDMTKYFGILGLVLGVIAVLLILPMIWEIVEFVEGLSKVMIISSIIAFSMAHISLLLGKMSKTIVKVSFFITLGLIFIVASMLSYAVLVEFDLGEWFWRIFGFFAVLNVVGSIVTPLTRKLTQN